MAQVGKLYPWTYVNSVFFYQQTRQTNPRCMFAVRETSVATPFTELFNSDHDSPPYTVSEPARHYNDGAAWIEWVFKAPSDNTQQFRCRCKLVRNTVTNPNLIHYDYEWRAEAWDGATLLGWSRTRKPANHTWRISISAFVAFDYPWQDVVDPSYFTHWNGYINTATWAMQPGYQPYRTRP